MNIKMMSMKWCRVFLLILMMVILMATCGIDDGYLSEFELTNSDNPVKATTSSPTSKHSGETVIVRFYYNVENSVPEGVDKQRLA